MFKLPFVRCLCWVACCVVWGLTLPLQAQTPAPAVAKPLMQAKAEALQSQGKNPFIELHLPDVAVSLQQGAGRLIRTQSDKGVLVICDRRLASANYGKSLLASLPPMRRVLTRAQLEQAMLELGLTKSCTRA